MLCSLFCSGAYVGFYVKRIYQTGSLLYTRGRGHFFCPDLFFSGIFSKIIRGIFSGLLQVIAIDSMQKPAIIKNRNYS